MKVSSYRGSTKFPHPSFRSRGLLIAAIFALILPLAACNDDVEGAAQADPDAVAHVAGEDAGSQPGDGDTGDDADVEDDGNGNDAAGSPADDDDGHEEDGEVGAIPGHANDADDSAGDHGDELIDFDDERFIPEDEWEIEEVQELEVPPDNEALTDDGCLLGTWYFSNSTFGSMLDDAVPGSANVSVSGRAKVTFYPDNTLTTVYDNWTTVVDGMEGGGKATIVRQGIDHGTYSISGDVLTVVDTQINSQLTQEIEVMGQVMTMPDPPTELETQSNQYLCFSDILLIQNAEDSHGSLMGRSAAFQ